ncbi:MAG: PIN domain-containing protein, partial [Spirochaetaceae bacterium]|nr:PIN domain-containing protein [Spirochaetaceae bacterium]
KFESFQKSEILVSAVTVAELEYGIAKSLYPEKNRLALVEFISSFEILPFTHEDIQPFGLIRAYLNKLGTPIGPYDLQLAAQCLSGKLILVTNNEKEFQRVPNLKVENWSKT